MGYTHYIKDRRAFTAEEWKRFTAEVAKIFAKHEKLLANGAGDAGSKPKFGAYYISFNGIEDDSHETCVIDMTSKEFDFCKTAQKPYDVAVVEVYKLVRDILGPDGVTLSSDGGSKVFGPTAKEPIDALREVQEWLQSDLDSLESGMVSIDLATLRARMSALTAAIEGAES